jgi:putative oxidoreductase
MKSRNFGRKLVSGTDMPNLPAEIGMTTLRVFAGLSMALAHGLGKIREPASEGLVSTINQLGLPSPVFFAWMVGITEFFGGIMLAAGLLTRISGAMLCFTMLVAGLAVHGQPRRRFLQGTAGVTALGAMGGLPRPKI